MEKKDYANYVKGFVALIYLGGVIVATVLFISFVLSAFDETQYVTRLIMVLGGVLVGMASIGYPLALHEWAIDGWHRWAAIALYAGELFLMSINVIVSFSVLRALQYDGVVEAWMLQYENYAVISVVYAIAAFGILFTLDPSHADKREDKKMAREKAEQERRLEKMRHDNQMREERLIAEKEAEFLDSIQGEDFIMAEAQKNIGAKMQQKSAAREKKNFGSAGMMKSYASDVDGLPNSQSQ